jgi:hypothetical protein
MSPFHLYKSLFFLNKKEQMEANQSDLILSAIRYANLFETQIRFEFLLNKFPHLLSFVNSNTHIPKLTTDSSGQSYFENTALVIPDKLKSNLKLVRYDLTEKLCKKLSCHDTSNCGGKETQCQRIEGVPIVSCQPACSQLYNDGTSLDFYWNGNKCIVANQIKKQFALYPHKRARVYVKGLTNVPSFSWDESRDSFKINKRYCDRFNSEFDETTDTCFHSNPKSILNLLVSSQGRDLLAYSVNYVSSSIQGNNPDLGLFGSKLDVCFGDDVASYLRTIEQWKADYGDLNLTQVNPSQDILIQTDMSAENSLLSEILAVVNDNPLLEMTASTIVEQGVIKFSTVLLDKLKVIMRRNLLTGFLRHINVLRNKKLSKTSLVLAVKAAIIHASLKQIGISATNIVAKGLSMAKNTMNAANYISVLDLLVNLIDPLGYNQKLDASGIQLLNQELDRQFRHSMGFTSSNKKYLEMDVDSVMYLLIGNNAALKAETLNHETEKSILLMFEYIDASHQYSGEIVGEGKIDYIVNLPENKIRKLLIKNKIITFNSKNEQMVNYNIYSRHLKLFLYCLAIISCCIFLPNANLCILFTCFIFSLKYTSLFYQKLPP